MFDGKLRRDDIGWQDTTSISLFVNDLECLLRDLYGDFGEDVIETTREAIFVIVQEFLRFTRNDLWLEHESARHIDYTCGIGVPEGVGLSGSDHRASQKCIAYLFDRARELGSFSWRYRPKVIAHRHHWRPSAPQHHNAALSLRDSGCEGIF
jgi:hypothetical protein